MSNKYPKFLKPHIRKQNGRWLVESYKTVRSDWLDSASAYAIHLNLCIKYGAG